MEQTKKILFCNCSYSDIIAANTKKRLTDILDQSGVDYRTIDDLCGLCANRDPGLTDDLANQPVTIVACYSRAVKWLFDAAGIPLPSDTEILNMREQTAEKIAQSLTGSAVMTQPNTKSDPPETKKTDWIPWFPVIDYSRCTNCKQCLNFCLFNVFASTEDGKIVVSNPRKCKTNCPACARVCPQKAIIFPKYKTAPFNGSDESVSPESISQVNLKSITKGDIYNKLRQRSCGCEPGSNSSNTGNSPQKLTELKEQLDIPDDVIQALTSSLPTTTKTISSSPCPCDCDCKSNSTDTPCICKTDGAPPCNCQCNEIGETQS
ncbi:MAG: hypothetical protein K9M57_01010 [Phycisphaerae bacterium]|nr:hypothetical protein [Phycisphaerae bacterium]